MSQCPYHGYDSLGCPGCRADNIKWTRDGVANGTLIFGVFTWRGDSKYRIDDAHKTYKRKSAAERFAQKHPEYVVRIVRTS